jgi:hypothetical protein
LVYERKDVSYDFTQAERGAARRLSLRVEVRQWPTSASTLTTIARNVVEVERGKGWHAISLFVNYDRREGEIPAFGIFEWAPDGKWEDAEKGDPASWSGYKFRIDLKDKVPNPGACTPPSDEALTYNDVYERASADGDVEDAEVFKDIASRHGVSAKRVAQLVEQVSLEWVFC